MADDQARDQMDKLVNLNSGRDEMRWCMEFKCTEQELRDAVSRVGPVAADVKRELEQQPRVTTLPT